MGSAAAFRAEDEALLERLLDEALLERVVLALAGPDARPLHPRAAGIFGELRTSDAGRAIVTDARQGELAPLLRMLIHPSQEVLTPALAHHLALLHAQLARELSTRPEEARRAAATDAWLRALAMWLWLGEERIYLARVGEEVVGSALPAAQRTRAVEEAPLEILAQLGERARAGARALSEPARLALAALARAGEAAKLAGLSEDAKKRALARARRERETAIEVALGRVEGALDEAIVRDAPADEITALLSDAAAVWRWSERDEQVERALIARITPYLWERYRAKQWDALRALLRPLTEPVDHLAAAIARDPTKLAYAAPCAQLLVFRAEVSTTFDAQLLHAEAAVRLCPTHRNGRLILSDLLAERAQRALDRAMPWTTPSGLDAIEKDVVRAEELFPELRRLPEVRKRLDAVKRGKEPRGD